MKGLAWTMGEKSKLPRSVMEIRCFTDQLLSRNWTGRNYRNAYSLQQSFRGTGLMERTQNMRRRYGILGIAL
jgi:hypothetical protein